MSAVSLLVNFKRVYTTQNFKIRVDPSWTIRTFITNAKTYLNEQTQINFRDIEIVEAGTRLQEQEINLEQHINLDRIFKEYFKLDPFAPSFYLRIRGEPIPASIMINQSNQSNQSDDFECPICLTTNTNTNIIRLVCNHNLCKKCYSRMLIYRLTSCPLCRHSINYV